MQRALLQFRSPKNRELVLRALVLAGREDLIGSGPDCLVRGPVPAHIRALAPRKPEKRGASGARSSVQGRHNAPGRPADRRGAPGKADRPAAASGRQPAGQTGAGGRQKGGFGKKQPRRERRP